MEKDFIEAMYQLHLEEINKKEWYDLTFDEIRIIQDPIKRKEYIEKYRFFVRYIINPLCRELSPKGYGFTEDITCKQMLKKMEQMYLKNNKSKEEMRNIIYGRLKHK